MFKLFFKMLEKYREQGVVCIRGLEIKMKILPIGSIGICNNYFLIKFNVFSVYYIMRALTTFTTFDYSKYISKAVEDILCKTVIYKQRQ